MQILGYFANSVKFQVLADVVEFARIFADFCHYLLCWICQQYRYEKTHQHQSMKTKKVRTRQCVGFSKYGVPTLDRQNHQSPTASVQQRRSTLVDHSTVPRRMNVTRMRTNRTILIARSECKVYEDQFLCGLGNI